MLVASSLAVLWLFRCQPQPCLRGMSWQSLDRPLAQSYVYQRIRLAVSSIASRSMDAGLVGREFNQFAAQSYGVCVKCRFLSRLRRL